MMIVDDTYIIVGSANINNRSLSGTRDTEIAIGAWQPHYVKDRAVGQVHQFRMSLWAEHMGGSKDYHVNPSDKHALQKVVELAKESWHVYAGLLVKNLPCHLMYYPIHVNADGSLHEYPLHHHIPDTNAKILGSQSAKLPRALTT